MPVSRIDPESDHCRPRDAPLVIDNRYLLPTWESLTALSKPEVRCGTLPRTSSKPLFFALVERSDVRNTYQKMTHLPQVDPSASLHRQACFICSGTLRCMAQDVLLWRQELSTNHSTAPLQGADLDYPLFKRLWEIYNLCFIEPFNRTEGLFW